jgi:hypothetical protein
VSALSHWLQGRKKSQFDFERDIISIKTTPIESRRSAEWTVQRITINFAES